MIVYILIVNNGEEYRDYCEWIEYVSDSIKKCEEKGATSTSKNNFFEIEQWVIGGNAAAETITYNYSENPTWIGKRK